MKNKCKLFSNFLILAFLCGAGISVQAQTIKCWENNEGVRECGTRIPPEFAQKGHEELNRQGMVVDTQDRALTKEEIAAKKQEEDAAREEKLATQERERKDKILLDVYTKVEDIEKARDDNIKVIESRITLTESRIEKTQADLDKRIQSAAAAERAGDKPNEHLLEDIDTLQKRITTYQAFIKEREEEIEGVRNTYNADIDRFKELKGI